MLGEVHGFGWPDWAVLGAYFLVLLASGAWFARRGAADTSDYFLGGRRMPAWAVAISLLATALSAATFIGGPEQAYRGDLRYLSANIGGILAAIVVALIFVPAFYRSRVSTVYELLEHRYGPAASMMGSGMFMVGRVFASGARLYMAALAGSLILFGDTDPGHLRVAIVVLATVAVVYTRAGGISSVIWTDVIQMLVFVLAACSALVVLWRQIPLNFTEIIDTLRFPGEGQASKLTVLTMGLRHGEPNLGFDPTETYTLLTALLGFTLFNIAAYGTDHDLAQRLLTCRSAARSSGSMIVAAVAGIPVTGLFMAVGLLLYIYYNRPDIMAVPVAAPDSGDSRKIFLYFIMEQMPRGMTGLMMAGLFAAGLSSLNSALNAMASTLVSDCYAKWIVGRSKQHYLMVSKCAVIGWGAVLALFAMICAGWHARSEQTLIDFALSVMTFAYAGLAAVFLCALVTRRGNVRSAVTAFVIGPSIVILLQPTLWNSYFAGADRWTPAFPWRMVAGTTVAFVVCCLGVPTKPSGRAASSRVSSNPSPPRGEAGRGASSCNPRAMT